MEHINNEEIPSTPATPGTPGVPLFGGFKSERSGNGSNKYKKSLLKNCKCFRSPPPHVLLAKKQFEGTGVQPVKAEEEQKDMLLWSSTKRRCPRDRRRQPN